MFNIVKKNGAKRRICNPDDVMRVLQYRILTGVLERMSTPDYLFAFEKNKGVRDLAERHTGFRYVASVDLAKYFDSIYQSDVCKIFEQAGVCKEMVRPLAAICTYKNTVSQGLITSPKISNLVTAMTWGNDLRQAMDNLNVKFSVYADDIVMSSNSLADIRLAIVECIKAIKNHGFKVNHLKTKIMPYYQRQYVCGVVVNEKCNPLKSTYYTLKAIIHNLRISGVSYNAKVMGVEEEKFLPILRGKIEWVKTLNATKGGKLLSSLELALEELKVREST